MSFIVVGSWNECLWLIYLVVSLLKFFIYVSLASFFFFIYMLLNFCKHVVYVLLLFRSPMYVYSVLCLFFFEYHNI